MVLVSRMTLQIVKFELKTNLKAADDQGLMYFFVRCVYSKFSDRISDVSAYGPSIYRTKSGYCCDVEKNKVYLTFGLIFLNFRELVMVVHEIQILQMCQDQPHEVETDEFRTSSRGVGV